MTAGRILAAVAAAISIYFVAQTGASAQYPPPKGSLVCQTAESKVIINGNITLVVTLRATDGSLMVNQNINFSIISSNGTASLSQTSGVTDGNGQAFTTIYAGSGVGTISVQATSDSVQCQAQLQIFNPCATPPACVPPTPQIEILTIRPPTTGSGGLAAGGSSAGDSALIAVVGMLGLVMAGAAVYSWRRDEAAERE